MISPQTRNPLILAAGIAALAVGLAPIAVAKPTANPAPTSYPERPITIVAPFSLGGNADTAARILAEYAPAYLGVPLVVVNRTGKDGAAGSVYVKNANPAGYTILMGGSSSHVALPAAHPETPYRPDDFTPLGIIELNGIGCAAANKQGSFTTAAELIRAMKASPEKVSYAWSGEVAGQFGKAFIKLAGGDLDKVKTENYAGASDSIKAVVDGKNTFVCTQMQALRGLAKLGTIKILFTNEKSRGKDFPTVPTVAELNLAPLEKIAAWSALFGPANLPRPVIDKWRAVLTKLSADDAWRKRQEQAGSTPHVLSPEESARFVAEQFEIYKQFVHMSTEKK